MGPQLYRCGNILAGLQASEQNRMLQWGRNFIVAEMRAATSRYAPAEPSFNGAATLSLRKYVRTSWAIARSHGFNGAATLSLRKSYRSQWDSRREACFNGAATLSLRKCRHLRGTYAGSQLASMGPQLYRCGNGNNEVSFMITGHASMGPQLYRCGNHSPTAPGSPRRNSFNRAATLSLRK